MKLSLGKVRRLQQATSPKGTFTVLALDHRGPIQRALARHLAAGEVDRKLRRLKQDIARELSASASAILLDPEHGLGACVESWAVPGGVGLLVALDTGSTGDPAELRTGLVEGWNAERVARSGASGAKLLVYYHPESPEAVAVEALVRATSEACDRAELPFFLEPLGYDPRQPGRRLSSRERRACVLETARRFSRSGVDVLKLEFPVDPTEDPDEAVWRDSCQELSAACEIPWVLLSAGVSYELFARQAAVACEAGASGVMAGRAVWAEAVTPDDGIRRSFLRDVGRQRLAQLRALCDALARPLTEFPRIPRSLGDERSNVDRASG